MGEYIVIKFRAPATGNYEVNKMPFTKEMKKDYTILMPQMAPIHFELLEAAVENTVPTTLSLFLKEKTQDVWVEYVIGTSTTPNTFEYTVQNLSFGVDYEWYVMAKGVHESGVEFPAVTTTKAFMTRTLPVRVLRLQFLI